MPVFDNYDMISDVIGWLGQNVNYKFVVKLSSKDKNGNRNSFHKEYSYNSTYNDTSTAMSIVRSFDYYITIENKQDGAYIQIRQHNMIMLQTILSQVTNYLFDENNWGIKNKKLVLKGKPQPLVIQNLPMSKWISFELIVIEYENIYDKGIRMTLGDESLYVDIRIDNFMGFVYFINTIDMYQCSLGLLNYMQRPDFGTNLITFENDQYNNKSNESYQGIHSGTTRTIPKKQNVSYFNKIDSL